MAGIDITSLFADVLPDPQRQLEERTLQQSDAANQASLVGELGGMAAYLAPQRGRAMAAAGKGLLGIDTRTKADKLKEQLESLGTPSTPQEHKAYADLLDKMRPGSGVQYMMGVAQEKRQQQQVDAQTTSAEAQASQAESAAAEVPATLSRAESLATQAATDEAALILAETTQEELVQWRGVTELHQNREAAIQEETNRIRALNEANLADDLGSRDKAAIREATAASRVFQDQATHARNIANQYKAMSPMAGAAGEIKTKWMKFMGNQTDAQLLKTNFTALRNTLVMANLPPGVASDKDIEIAMSGYPDASWSGEKIEQFMRGMAKVAALRAEQEDARATYMYNNKGLDVGFNAAWKETTDAVGYDQKLAEKYGLEWVPNDEALAARTDKIDAARLAAAEARLASMPDVERANRAAAAFNRTPALGGVVGGGI